MQHNEAGQDQAKQDEAKQDEAKPLLYRKHWLLWDGECNFCCRTVSWFRWKDKRGRFLTTAYQKAPSPPMTPALHAACENAVHVVKTDGTTLRAGRAVLFILSEIGYGAISRLLSLPPFFWGVELLYKIVASHRDFFANFFFTKDHSAQAPELPLTDNRA